MDAISQTTFSNAFSWMKMYGYRLKFHWNLFLRVQLTISQHRFRYPNQWWLVYWRIYALLGLNVLNETDAFVMFCCIWFNVCDINKMSCCCYYYCCCFNHLPIFVAWYFRLRLFVFCCIIIKIDKIYLIFPYLLRSEANAKRPGHKSWTGLGHWWCDRETTDWWKQSVRVSRCT